MFSNQTKFVHCLNVRIWIVARQAFRGWPRERICAGSFHFSATPQTFCAPQGLLREFVGMRPWVNRFSICLRKMRLWIWGKNMCCWHLGTDSGLRHTQGFQIAFRRQHSSMSRGSTTIVERNAGNVMMAARSTAWKSGTRDADLLKARVGQCSFTRNQ
jgi:hypothetical protein